MKRFIQTTLFIVVMATIIINSRKISNNIIEQYNSCVSFMASRTVIAF